MKTLIYNARILTMDRQQRVIEGGWLLTDGCRISALGERTEPLPEADTVIDAREGILLPGFVNTHCHVSMVPFRSLGDDCPDRLRRFLFPLENSSMNRELVYLGALYGIAEMLLSGTTTFLDMYYFEDEVARACMDTGIRGYLGETIIGQPTCDSPDDPYGGFEYQENLFEKYEGSSRVIPIIAPHGTTTLSPEMLAKAHTLAVSKNTVFTLHAAEMDYEMEHFAKKGMTPIEFLDSIGALSEHTLAAHCIHATESDLALMKKRGSRIAHCIVSNTKAGKGVAPMKEAAALELPFGLGTDGPSSGNTLSMFDQMRMLPNAQKTRCHDRSIFPAAQVVYAATAGGADALGSSDFGRLEPGMKADLQLVETGSVNMFPAYNPYSALVYSANSSNVELVMADGKILVRDGKLTELDLGEIRSRLQKAMEPFVECAKMYPDVI